MSADDAYALQRASVRQSFARAVETYDAAAVLQRTVLDRLLERVPSGGSRPTVVLDAGSGTGLGARALARRFRRARVIALDIAEPMAARSRQRRPWFRSLDAVCADAARLPLAGRSVDLVFSNLMLQWVDDPTAVFTEFLRAMKPGAQLLFTTFGPDTLHELRSAWATVDDHVHVNRFIDMHDLGDALLHAGFRDPVMDVERMTVTYPDVMGLMRDLKAIGAHNSNTGRPHALTGRGKLKAMQDAYERERRDGVLPASWEVVFGFAIAPPADARGARPDDTGTVKVQVSSIRRSNRGSVGAPPMRRE